MNGTGRGIILSEIMAQKKTSTTHYPYLWNLKNKTNKTNRLWLKNKLMVTRRKEGRGKKGIRDSEAQTGMYKIIR